LFTPDQIGKILLGIGGIIALVGVVFLLAGRLGLGRLPGDIIIRRENLTVYFPITTMIIVSIILTLIFSLFRR
jgi:heme/copper-type cytochrome/quinol oxidase subunit 2